MNVRKPKKPQCQADEVDDLGESVWDVTQRKCSRCNLVYLATERACPNCASPEFSLIPKQQ